MRASSCSKAYNNSHVLVLEAREMLLRISRLSWRVDIRICMFSQRCQERGCGDVIIGKCGRQLDQGANKVPDLTTKGILLFWGSMFRVPYLP